MKFSVLLPTRNRLEYLRYAIETVRRQDYSEWEIIVSDNFSEDDIGGYVRSLADARIRYLRTASAVPVTENWNNALRHSTGDYVVMLGDDDGLLPGYFSKLARTFDIFPNPDYVYVGAYFFAYPGAIPDSPNGFLRRDRNRIFTEDRPFWLDNERALKVGLEYLDFRMPVASNMQFSLISRRKIDELTSDGAFFRSPFPDFYATPLLFLRSHKILVFPQPMVVIGITPKSYGAFHFSNRAAEGVQMLHNQSSVGGDGSLQSVMLPGTSYNDSWLLAMQALSTQLRSVRDMKPNYRRYRFLQILHGFKRCYFDASVSAQELAPLRRKMTVGEQLIYGYPMTLGFRVLRLVPSRSQARIIAALRRLIGQHAIQREAGAGTPEFQSLLEVFESFDSVPALA